MMTGRGVATPVFLYLGYQDKSSIRMEPIMARRKNNKDKPMAYAWVAYMVTHHPEEMARVRRFGTPSDELIKLAEEPVGMTLSDGKYKMITFPKSLNTRAGQKL